MIRTERHLASRDSLGKADASHNDELSVAVWNRAAEAEWASSFKKICNRTLTFELIELSRCHSKCPTSGAVLFDYWESGHSRYGSVSCRAHSVEHLAGDLNSPSGSGLELGTTF